MTRKNLTAAILAGLAGAAGLAGTAHAVNVNPDGTGEVLIYPYYTTNDGNQTLVSVVNTTAEAKAVKVRFLEGFNSREVLDFNLYLSPEDVWVAAIVDGGDAGYPEADGVPHLIIPDTSCTVPYLYGMGVEAGLPFGLQAFLNYAYTGDAADGITDSIERAGEGHLEMIEMGTISDVINCVDSTGATVPPNSDGSCPAKTTDKSVRIAKAVTHVDGFPADCLLLTDLWTKAITNTGAYDPTKSGQWFVESWGTGTTDANQEVTTGTSKNSGGLFGGASVVNAANGTMFSYDARAIQGFEGDQPDSTVVPTDVYDGVHYRPGTIYPSLNSGGEQMATVFTGGGDKVELTYTNPVDAVSAVFMHDKVMNEYVVEEALNAGTEWVITFPTRNFYVDGDRMAFEGLIGEQKDAVAAAKSAGTSGVYEGWTCTVTGTGTSQVVACDSALRAPFTAVLGAELCEVVSLQTWDREEDTYVKPTTPGDTIPPTVSPSPPQDFTCEDFGTCPTFFDLCNEVNVLRFGENSVFGTPDLDGDSLLLSVEDEFDAGWGRVNMENGKDKDDNNLPRMDEQGLKGLPVAGFAAFEFENGYLDGGSVKANYGGIFSHKTSVLYSALSTAP